MAKKEESLPERDGIDNQSRRSSARLRILKEEFNLAKSLGKELALKKELPDNQNRHCARARAHARSTARIRASKEEFNLAKSLAREFTLKKTLSDTQNRPRGRRATRRKIPDDSNRAPMVPVPVRKFAGAGKVVPDTRNQVASSRSADTIKELAPESSSSKSINEGLMPVLKSLDIKRLAARKFAPSRTRSSSSATLSASSSSDNISIPSSFTLSSSLSVSPRSPLHLDPMPDLGASKEASDERVILRLKNRRIGKGLSGLAARKETINRAPAIDDSNGSKAIVDSQATTKETQAQAQAQDPDPDEDMDNYNADTHLEIVVQGKSIASESGSEAEKRPKEGRGSSSLVNVQEGALLKSVPLSQITEEQVLEKINRYRMVVAPASTLVPEALFNIAPNVVELTQAKLFIHKRRGHFFVFYLQPFENCHHVIDGSNLALNDPNVLSELNTFIGCELRPIRFDQQRGVGQDASSAVVICLVIMRLHPGPMPDLIEVSFMEIFNRVRYALDPVAYVPQYTEKTVVDQVRDKRWRFCSKCSKSLFTRYVGFRAHFTRCKGKDDELASKNKS